ncbi:uncharacterized protein LOC116143984 [Pistacia vera]|uniref:uncharacterized protein LOC116143984 n=1 Tax=Pistacia vera TaxID=55513 RepID=UPI0012637928|nr:uncharacterized protein LOC116143984 [Pistacia vera]
MGGKSTEITATPSRSDGFRRLSKAEVQFKRDRTLCSTVTRSLDLITVARESLQILLVLDDNDDIEKEKDVQELDDAPLKEELDDLVFEVQHDPKLKSIMQDLLLDSSSHPHYRIHNYYLLYKDSLPTKQAFSPQTSGLLQPLPIPYQVFNEVSMDFIDELLRAKGYDTVLVVVDRLTKYNHFIHPYNAKDIAAVFVNTIVNLHGFPKSIVSDRDRVFINQFWQELFKGMGTSLKFSSTYHPQIDGQTEVVNRCLESYLRCFCSYQPKQWYIIGTTPPSTTQPK